MRNQKSADVIEREKSQLSNCNELGIDIQEMLKRSAEFIENRPKPIQSRKPTTAVSHPNSTNEPESHPIPHQSKPTNFIPTQSKVIGSLPDQPKSLGSNLSDLLCRLKTDKKEDYLKKVEMTRLSFERRQQQVKRYNDTHHREIVTLLCASHRYLIELDICGASP